jgi:hypothetical protein
VSTSNSLQKEIEIDHNIMIFFTYVNVAASSCIFSGGSIETLEAIISKFDGLRMILLKNKFINRDRNKRKT